MLETSSGWSIIWPITGLIGCDLIDSPGVK
jgi:hypothetical protein